MWRSIRALNVGKSRYFKLHISGVEDINALYKSIIDPLVLTNVESSVQTLLKHSNEERRLFRLILQEVFTNGVVKAQALARKLNETSGSVKFRRLGECVQIVLLCPV